MYISIFSSGIYSNEIYSWCEKAVILVIVPSFAVLRWRKNVYSVNDNILREKHLELDYRRTMFPIYAILPYYAFTVDDDLRNRHESEAFTGRLSLSELSPRDRERRVMRKSYAQNPPRDTMQLVRAITRSRKAQFHAERETPRAFHARLDAGVIARARFINYRRLRCSREQDGAIGTDGQAITLIDLSRSNQLI